MTPRSRPYEEGLYKRLKDPEEAVLYLRAALGDSREAWLTALRHVAEANLKEQV